MTKLTPPAVPPKLRELLKDYPEHIERLQEVLNKYAEVKPGAGSFEAAFWALQGRLDTFIDEATRELEAAKAEGAPIQIERADAKRELMFLASSSNGGMRVLDDLWDYFVK